MVTIPLRFNGPAHSGNGGYVAGMLAHMLPVDGPVTSTLRLPPPLDTPLSWEHDTAPDGSGLVRLLTAGGAVIGDAAPGSFVRDVPTCPSPGQAARGREVFAGFASHPFDHCFTCGTARVDGDGLRLFTGPVSDGVVAAPWTPHAGVADADGVLDVPTTWAALDCPGGWAADFTQRTMVLGRMTAEIVRRPRADEPCLAVGALSAQEGRKFLTGTALFTIGGDLLGRAEQVWIEVDPAAFR